MCVYVCSHPFPTAIYHFSVSFFSSTLQRILYKDLQPPVRNLLSLWLKQDGAAVFPAEPLGIRAECPSA